MSKQVVGEIQIERIVESVCTEFDARRFFPHTTEEDWARHRPWMEPWALVPDTGKLVLTIQAFLIRTPRHTILVDTCVGDHKPRPHRPFWHLQKLDTFLPRLAAAGVAPEQVDYVFCTHLHGDHVGWNTLLRDGRWVPTFPRARYIFSRRELAGMEALNSRIAQPQYADSVLPILEAGQAQLVEDDFALDDQVHLEPTPGHTAGHVCVHAASQGARAVVTGDCIHSPVQCLHPEWTMFADLDPAQASATRRLFLERYCDSGVLVCATHFPQPSFGHLTWRDRGIWFDYGDKSAPSTAV